MLSEKRIPNRLIQEKSPYLRQHAYNPVDWYPWGNEPFEKAEKENKPLLISIGYSTCHWCHVMERETFEDIETAAMLLKDFVCIKVDREERPDIDAMYMSACQLLTGSGGWPLTIIADAQKRPVFAGTYFTKNRFQYILKAISDMWKNSPNKLRSQAEHLISAMQTSGSNNKTVDYEGLEQASQSAFLSLSSHFDREYGGFSGAPKFPTPHNLLFLLDYYKFSGETKSLDMCTFTLKAMRRGGIFDHVGGGFSRYSTDKYWLAPHFEKMLYDNTLLMIAYLKCFEITKDSLYSDTAKEIAAYLIRDMHHKDGGFYAAEDADSEGHEGLFYTFTLEEIQGILKNDADEFCGYFNITSRGNFEGRNILNTIGREIPPHRKEFALSCLKKIFEYRNSRIRPDKDDKILVSYNGLAITAFTMAGRILKDSHYTDIAVKTAEFIEKKLRNSDRKLFSFYLDGAGKQLGFAEDYSFYIWGLTELYNTVKDEKYLKTVIELQNIFTEGFYDKNEGGFFISDKSSEQIPVRAKEFYDSAVPSYNSVSLHNLLSLYNFTDNIKYIEQFIQTLKYFSDEIVNYPNGYIHSVSAVMKLTADIPELQVCTGGACRPPAKSLTEFIKYFSCTV